MKQDSTLNEKVSLTYWAGVLVLALAVRLCLLYNYYTINNDGIFYIQAARHFWKGNWGEGLASFHAPLYPLMIAAAFPLVGDWELAGQLWSFVLGALMIFPLFALFRRIFSARVAMIALFGFAVSPYVARLTVEVRTEIPYIFFMVSGLYFLQRGLDSRKVFFSGLTGINAGLAYLLRPEGIGLVMVGALFLLYRGWLEHRWGKLWLQLFVMSLGIFLLAAPYVLYLKGETGRWLISRKAGFMLSEGLARYGADTGQVTHETSERVSITHLIASSPLLYARKVSTDFFRFIGLYFEALHYSYLPFLFIGWVSSFRERFWEKKDFLLFLFVFFYLVTLSLIYPARRYGIPLATVSLGWVGVGYLMVDEYCRKKWEAKGPVLLGLLLVLFLTGTLPKTLQGPGWDKFYLREAGVYLRGKEGSPTILSGNFRVAFYAEGQNRVFFVTEESRVRGFLEAQELDYLALDGETFEKLQKVVINNRWLLEKQFSGVRDEKIFILRRAGSR